MPKLVQVAKFPQRRGSDALPGSAQRILAANAAPHPRWLDALPNAVAALNKGGSFWVIGVLAACLFRVPGSGRALRELVPSVIVTTLVVEYPLKAVCRRPRPLRDTLRSLILRGRSSGPSSFPSGHTAASFAAAWILSTVWPRWAPAFLGLASAAGFQPRTPGRSPPE
jgi:membrane-associated phospholipid phosphatase